MMLPDSCSQLTPYTSCTRQICFVAFLPNVIDSTAAGRNKYIATLKAIAAHFKTRPFGWVWAAAGTQPELESAVGVGGFGYPALTAVNSRKKRYATSASAFNEGHIKEFVNLLVCVFLGCLNFSLVFFTSSDRWLAAKPPSPSPAMRSPPSSRMRSGTARTQ